MPNEPNVSADEMAAHGAATDEALSAILGDLDDDPAEVVAETPEEPEVVSDEPGEPSEVQLDDEDADEGLEDDEPEEGEAEEAEEDTALEFTEDQRFDAIQALRRDGLSAAVIKAMPEAEQVAYGLKRQAAQVEGDRAFGELQRLRGSDGQDSQEAREGQGPGSGEPGDGPADPGKTGADLTSLALPFAKTLAEMEDPEKVASELVAFTEKAIQASATKTEQKLTQATNLNGALMQRAVKQELGADFEGNLDELGPAVIELGQTNLYADKDPIDRAVALFRAAQALATEGKPVPERKTKTSTSRARKRGSAPPISGKRTPPRTLKPTEVVDKKLSAILNGERDVQKLRGIG